MELILFVILRSVSDLIIPVSIILAFLFWYIGLIRRGQTSWVFILKTIMRPIQLMLIILWVFSLFVALFSGLIAPGANIVAAIVFTLFFGSVALLVRKTIACLGQGKTTSKWVKSILIVIWIVLLSVVVLVGRGCYEFNNQVPPNFAQVEKNEGLFPLYEEGFSTTVSMDQHPYLLNFRLAVNTLEPLYFNLDDIVLKLEAIEDGQVIGSRLVHGSEMRHWGGSGAGRETGYLLVRVHNKRDSEDTKNYFGFRKPATYRLTVIQPCEEYDCVTTELRTDRCY